MCFWYKSVFQSEMEIFYASVIPDFYVRHLPDRPAFRHMIRIDTRTYPGIVYPNQDTPGPPYPHNLVSVPDIADGGQRFPGQPFIGFQDVYIFTHGIPHTLSQVL